MLALKLLSIVFPLFFLPQSICNTNEILGEFGKPITVSVNYNSSSSITFIYTQKTNDTRGIRFHANSSNADKNSPVLLAIRQEKAIQSFQLPFVINQIHLYNFLSRTLCETINNQPGQKDIVERRIVVDISSNLKINDSLVTINVEWLEFNIHLMTDSKVNVTISPTEPHHFLFEFPEGINKVDVEVSSPTNSCMALSIQDVNCPVYDRESNYRYQGFYQSVSEKGLIKISKKNFQERKIHVVVIAFSNSTSCLDRNPVNFEDKGQSINYNYSNHNPQQKNISILIRESVLGNSNKTILPIVIIGCLFVFILFCIASFTSCRFRGTVESNYEKSANNQTVIELQLGPDDSIMTENNVNSSERIDVSVDNSVNKNYLHFVSQMAEGKEIKRRRFDKYFIGLLAITIFYALPAFELVFTHMKVFHKSGDQDKCYYNFQCLRKRGTFESFNNIFSNIGYIFFGLAFSIICFIRSKHYDYQSNEAKELGLPRSFGLYYTMGGTLFVEGVMSAIYHVCPSPNNFQFDTSFMYIMSFLTTMKILEIRHVKVQISSTLSFFLMGIVIFIGLLGFFREPISCSIFIVTLFVVNVFVAHRMYFLFHWNKSVDFYIGGCLSNPRDDCCPQLQEHRNDWLPWFVARSIPFFLITIGHLYVAIKGLIDLPDDFFKYILNIFMGNLGMYLLYYLIHKGAEIWRNRNKNQCNSWLLFFRIFIISLLVASFAIWFYALSYFHQPAYRWDYSPALSRNINTNCIWLDFFDAHDVWHFLSAFALFLTFLVLLLLDEDLNREPRQSIVVF